MNEIRAEMAATVWRVITPSGSPVRPGDLLVILESMKMEIPVESDRTGIVEIHVAEGQVVQEHDVIAVVEPAAPSAP